MRVSEYLVVGEVICFMFSAGHHHIRVLVFCFFCFCVYAVG